MAGSGSSSLSYHLPPYKSNPYKGPSAQTFTLITVVTPWIRGPLFRLTMADPVQVMLGDSIKFSNFVRGTDITVQELCSLMLVHVHQKGV